MISFVFLHAKFAIIFYVIFLLTLALLCTLSCAFALSKNRDFTVDLDASKQDLDRGVRNKDEECRLFLAESSISNAGFGVFVGVDIEGGEVISSHDISVPMLHFIKKKCSAQLKGERSSPRVSHVG